MSHNPFLNNFDCQRDVESQYELEPGFLDGATFLVADYTYEDYSGSSFVLYEMNGKLYENHSSHCSCYGLEGQFSPEETTVDELRGRLARGALAEYEYVLNEALTYLEKGKKVKKVIYFEATDGSRFDNEVDCQQYEDMCELTEAIYSYCADISSTQAAEIATGFIDNYTFKAK